MINLIFLCFFYNLDRIFSICIPGTLPGTCVSCNSNSFSQTLIDNFGGSVAETDCQSKSVSLNTNFFVQSTACASGSACDGSSSSPFDSLINCLVFVHKSASKYQNSKIIIFLLTGNHFLLAKDLPLSSNINPFFRRVSIDLTIQPLYCSVNNIPGCFTNTSDVANIFLKTNKFMIFINNILTLQNLIFSSIDSVLENKGDACLSSKSGCCAQTDLNNSASVCNIQGLSVSLIPLTSSFIPSFFVIEGIFESTDTNTPTLLCVGVQFNYFNAFNSINSFNSFIAIANTNPIINLTNTIIQFSFFPFGIISSYDFTLDSFYSKIDSTQKTQFITKYSSLAQNLVFSNLNLANYNFYQLNASLGLIYFRFKDKKSTLSISQSIFQNFTHIFRSATLFDIMSQTLTILNSNFTSLSSLSLFDCQQTTISITSSSISKIINTFDSFFNQNLCVITFLSSSILNLSFKNNVFSLQKNSSIFANNSLLTLINGGTIFNLQVYSLLNFTFSNITYCTYNQYSSSQNSSHYYISSNMYNLGNGDVFYLSNNDSILFRNFNMENVTAGTVFLGTFAENNQYFNCLFKNVMSVYLESFGFLPYFSYHQNTTYINITAINFFSVSDPFITGSKVYWKGVDTLVANSTITGIYIFCIWSRDFFINNTILSNISSTGSHSLVNTYSISTTAFFINNLTIVSSKLNNTSGYHANIDSYVSARLALVNIQNISINIPASDDFNFDANAIFFQTCDYVYMKNISVVRDKFKENFFFYGISMLSIPLAVIDTVYLGNLSCSKIASGFDNTLGILTAIGFPSFEFNSNSRTLNLSNVYIDTVNCQQSSGIGIVNINSVTIINVTIKNSITQKFASFFFFQSISTLILTNSSLYNGSNIFNGGITLNTVLNSTFSMISAELSTGGLGGLFWISNSNLKISNLFASKITCNSGGLIYQFNNGNIQITNANFSNSNAMLNGGGIYVINSNLLANSLNFSNINCEQGAAFYIYSGILVDIGFVICKNCTASQKGNFALVMESASLTIHDSGSFYASSLSQGTIFIYSQVKKTYNFYNINCINLTHYDGSCFYLYTNSIINIQYVNIKNCTGGAIFIYSAVVNTFYFANLIIQNHNSLIPSLFSNASKYLLQSSGIILNIKGIEISKSFIAQAFQFDFGQLDISEMSCINIAQEINSYFFDFQNIESVISNYTFIGLEKIENKHLKSIDSVATFTNSSFSMIYSETLTGFLLENSQLFIFNSKFVNSSGFGGLILLIDSNISVLNSTFTNMQNLIQQSLNFIYSKIESIDSINNLVIIESSFLSMNFGALIKIDSCFNVTIDKSNFTSANKSSFSLVSGINIFNTDNSLVSNSLFVNLNNDFGGAIFIENSNLPKLLITILNTRFINCSAQSGGSIYIQGNSSFVLNNSQVENSHAILRSGIGGIGGGLLYNCYYISEICQTALFNTTFKSNEASLYGSNFIGRSTLQMIQVNLFQSASGKLDEINFPIDVIFLSEINSADKLKNFYISNTHISKSLTGNSEISFSNQSSGNGFSFSFALVDSNNMILSYDNSSTANIDAQLINSSNNSFIQNGATLCVNGIFYFSNFICSTYPPAHLALTFHFTINILNPKTNILEIINITKNANLTIRECLRGEIITTDSSCQKCGEGYYSLKDPMKGDLYQECILCPLNADCPGGDAIIPYSGYWRSSNDSILIQQCLNPTACDTIKSSNGTPLYSTCANGYSGNFCFECQPGYARINSNGQCVFCNADPFNYVKFIVYLLAISIFIMFQVKYYMVINENNSPVFGVLLKIFVNHFQQLSLITLVNLGWTSQIKGLFSFFSYFSFLNDDILSVDCFFSNVGYYVLFFKILFSNFFPVLIAMSVILLSFMSRNLRKNYKVSKNKNKFKKEIKVTLAVTIYILYPAILKSCFELLNCKTIDELSNLSVLWQSPSLPCFNLTHILWIIFVALPGILFWGVISLIFFYFLLSKSKKELMSILDTDQSDKLFEKKTKPSNEDQIQSRNKKNTSEKYIGHGEEESDSDDYHVVELKINPNVSLENLKIEKQEKDTKSVGIKDQNEISKGSKELDENKDMFQNKDKLIYYIMFLYRGYKGKFYYWELLIFSKKFILILLTSFNNIIGNYTKSSLLIIFFVTFLIVTKQAMPYSNSILNKVELLSYYTLFLTTNIGILLFSKELQYLAYFLMIIVGILQGSFCIVSLYYFFTLFKKNRKLHKSLNSLKSMPQSLIRSFKSMVGMKTYSKPKIQVHSNNVFPTIQTQENLNGGILN